MRALSTLYKNLSESRTATFATFATVALAVGLTVSLLAPIAGAESKLVRVNSNAGEVASDNASLVLVIGAENDGDVAELEVDHSLDQLQDDDGNKIFPEFSVYADESNPYGGDAALFQAAGVSVEYDNAISQWTIDFGEDITQGMKDESTDGLMRFNFALKDADGEYLWGSMNNTTEENTFQFNLLSGEGDALEPEESSGSDGQAGGGSTDDSGGDEDDAVVPGVPNTATAK